MVQGPFAYRVEVRKKCIALAVKYRVNSKKCDIDLTMKFICKNRQHAFLHFSIEIKMLIDRVITLEFCKYE